MAKEILYGIEARNALCRGVDKLADTVKMDGVEYTVLSEDDILAIVE